MHDICRSHLHLPYSFSLYSFSTSSLLAEASEPLDFDDADDLNFREDAWNNLKKSEYKGKTAPNAGHTAEDRSLDPQEETSASEKV